MIGSSKGILWYATLIAAIVVADEWIKSVALTRLPSEESLSNPGILEFAVHKNMGIAFDIPFKIPLIVLVSVIIGAVLIDVIRRNVNAHPDIALSALTIVIGAAGNLYDRLVYGFTVDYVILFARSAINISDIVILIGVLCLLLTSRRLRREHKHGDTVVAPHEH